jgi:hypothetical protein
VIALPSVIALPGVIALPSVATLPSVIALPRVSALHGVVALPGVECPGRCNSMTGIGFSYYETTNMSMSKNKSLIFTKTVLGPDMLFIYMHDLNPVSSYNAGNVLYIS